MGKNRQMPANSSGRAAKKLELDIMDMIAAPVITFSSSWADLIPRHILENIPMARMVAAMKNEELATIPEVVAYLYTRSFEAPMSNEWNNISLWCCSQYAEKYTGSAFPGSMAPDKLSDYEWKLLSDLRRWIYRKRRECVKDRINKK